MEREGALDRAAVASVLALALLSGAGAASLLFFESFRPFAWLALPLAAAAPAPVLWRWKGGARPSRATALALGICGILFLQATVLHHPSIHIGRDDGVYAMQAWTFALEEKPGFDDAHRRTWMGVDDAEGYAGGAPIFPPSYAVLLAIGHVWGGDLGSYAVDGVIVALTGLFLYLIARRFTSEGWALFPLAAFGLFYGTLWFSRRFTSESLQLLLLLGAAFLLIRGRPWLGAIPVAALLLTRVDTVFFPASYLVAALLLRESRGARAGQIAGAVGAFSVSLIALVWSLRINPGYMAFHLGVIPTFVRGLSAQSPTPTPTAELLTADVASPGYVVRRLHQWGLTPFLLLGGLGLVLDRPTRRAAALFLFLAPSLVYLLSPAISPDQPFFFRRYYGGLVAVAFLFGAFVLAQAARSHPMVSRAVAFGLLVLTGALSAPIMTLVEWEDVPTQLDAMAREVPESGALMLPPGIPGGFSAYLEMRAGVPSVYMRSVPPGLPPGSPMTLENWQNFVPQGHEPIIVSEIDLGRATTYPPSPYVETSELDHIDSHSLDGTRIRRTCDFFGAFHGIQGQTEAEGCAPTPPRSREDWALHLHFYRLNESQR